jgi:hypothetical protein
MEREKMQWNSPAGVIEIPNLLLYREDLRVHPAVKNISLQYINPMHRNLWWIL